MANKMYRSALGKPVDMGTLLSKNETVRAVGNMGVNARGDAINKTNETVSTRSAQVNDQYRKQIRNQIVDAPVALANSTVVDKPAESIEGLDTPLNNTNASVATKEEVATEATPTVVKKTGGLASAIAKAREVEQKKLKTPREEARDKTGVKKI